MDKLRSLTVAAAVAFALAACAQNETAPDDTTASTSGSTSTSTTAEGASPDSSSSTSSASYPDSSASSSSSTTASTTADPTTPDQSASTTPDQSASTTPDQSASTTPDSSSSTASSTGSMDSSTGTMSESGADASATAGASTGALAIGVQVESETGEPLGTVTDLVADPTTGAPMFVVISTEGETTAMPYSAASSMVQGDALVIERTRLASAPRVEQSELQEPTADWTSEANDYWGQGEMRTASPETAEEPVPEGEPRG